MPARTMIPRLPVVANLLAVIFCVTIAATAQELPSILEQAEIASVASALVEVLPPPREHGTIGLRFRIPAAMIVESINRDYSHTAPIDRTVLGTHSRGQAVCDGQVRCTLTEKANGLELQCWISGQVTSVTCGTNGPATIQSKSTTWYTANKPIFFDGLRFSSQPVSLNARSALAITGIGSTAPRLRGRIVRRVAASRATESQPQAEEITRLLTEQELRQKIDLEFDSRIAALNEKLAQRLDLLRALSDSGRTLSVNSFADCVEVSLAPSDVPLFQTPALTRDGPQQSVELWLYFHDFTIPDVALANLLASVPQWLSTYFTKNQTLARLAEQKVDIERHGNWLMVQLLEH